MRDLSDRPLHGETRGRAGDPRLVLVHGFTQTGRSWGPLADDLARDHEVVTVDAPGHGGSADVRADLAEGGALLADRVGPATFVGYSMGGRFCLHAALARPELVTRLVLLGATAGIDDPAERAARVAGDEQLAVELEREGVDAFLGRWLARPMFAALPDDPADRADRSRNTAEGLASSLRLAGTGTQVPSWDRLHTLAMPVLVLAGQLDTTFATLGARMAREIGPNATFAVVPGAGHAAHKEQAGAFLRLVRAWLG
jgi:2-succinyl-6-hydroxy-2,4-cyclohexadiene-1-carboxylate synthase